MAKAFSVVFQVFGPLSVVLVLYALVWFFAPRGIRAVFRREVGGFFNSPLAYVFIIIFVLMASAFTFLIARFLDSEEASLTMSFFQWHPWLFIVLGPAVGMRLWSEENRLGTAELILTMPIAPWQVIVGKFLAASLVLFVALFLTFPIVLTVGYLGDPDVGTILGGYIGSFLLASTTLAVTLAVSALTRSQVVCLIVAVLICLVLTLIGYEDVVKFFRDSGVSWFANAIERSSMLYHFRHPSQGLVRLENVVYFLSVICFSLFLTAVVVRSRRT